VRHVARGKAIEHAPGIDQRAAVECIRQLVQFLSGGCLILSHNPPQNDHVSIAGELSGKALSATT
jgi:hypothetical protein